MKQNDTGIRWPATVILNHYNCISGTKAVRPYENNLKMIDQCLELNGYNEDDLCDYMSWYVLYKNDQELKPDFNECMQDYHNYYRMTASAYFEANRKRDPDRFSQESFSKPAAENPKNELPDPLDEPKELIPENMMTEGKQKKECPEGKKMTVDKRNVPADCDTLPEGDGREDENRNRMNQKEEPAEENVQQNPLLVTWDSLMEKIRSAVSSSVSDQYGKMLDSIRNEAARYVKEQLGEQVQRIRLTFDDSRFTPPDGEIVHERLPEILKFVAAREPVYLVGPAGCGKNHICRQIAGILNLPFYYSNSITQEYKLTGFTDANGIYHETPFYKAFRDGGIFLLDELDASIPEALIVINAAISNGYFDFPDPIGFVEAHRDFRVVAAGNTWGNGADIQYVGRNQLDMASLDRFAFVKLDYSRQVESVLCPDTELATFLREYRNAVNRNGIMSAVSYRAFRRMYLLESNFSDLPDFLDFCLCKGLCRDDLLLLYKNIRSQSRYKEALMELVGRRDE